MARLFDVEVDLSSNDGGLPRDSFRDGMRVRLMGNSVERRMAIPKGLSGSIFFVNDGDDDVQVRLGISLPVRVSRGACVHVMLDGERARMWKVE